MIKAAIDIGTNSVRLLLCELSGDKIVWKEKKLEMTRIGKDVDATKALDGKRMTDTVNALKAYKGILLENGLTTCPVFATSAVRDASNRIEFVNLVKLETGFDIQVITGVEEANLGFMGVALGAGSDANTFLVVDIGGGSTELIVGTRDGKVLFAHSLDIGAVRMTDRHALKHESGQVEFEPVRTDVDRGIDSIMEELGKFEIGACIGIGGTITTLGAMDLKMDEYDADRIQNHKLSRRTISGLADRLIRASLDEKLLMTGLMPKRADIIAAGATVMDEIMQKLSIEEVAVSDYDNLEGAIFKELLTCN
ncbi:MULTISPECIES: Ppx/GppA phosphatase family protein [unclassified Fusibacter]|uniref:Ppx/GppA phosphatase family protein n=1 Tax=unclassified Fusibacter TaxID=2624464 RepID=UPI0010101921|nr:MULTISPECIES: Ppx/GppA phosphatase family protein [unclassified Fusibacter]MCK8059529.1 Ppx/GppA family phosphatase [Fusibacter sp. A2]NPE21007.1 Ppx/GppA family phosphatase [Fusibacter sp. A1]RXV62281.1 Ppx/GppA family phosphatase [Fusibacter sp. A1]